MESALKNAIVAVLAPFVRFLIGRGWTYPVLSELLKAVYVAQALHAEGETASDSRLSLLTGVHRKDVKRLRGELRAHGALPPLRRGVSVAARVVAQWVSSRRYRDARGRPRVLPLKAARGVSFEGLARDSRADMRPSVILEELVRAGVAEVSHERVRLLRNAYVSAAPDDKLAFLGANVGDHVRSAVHNIDGREGPFIERAVYYDAVPAEALERLRAHWFSEADRLLREVNGEVMPLDEEDRARGKGPHRRMRFGIYYYEDDAGDGDKNGGKDET